MGGIAENWGFQNVVNRWWSLIMVILCHTEGDHNNNIEKKVESFI